jgi:hypothetical protein
MGSDLFARIGGQATVDRLVDNDRIEEDTQLRSSRRFIMRWPVDR